MIRIFLFTFTFVFLICKNTAFAQYTFCNKSSYAIKSAIAYEKNNSGILTSYGWWQLRPGECKNVISDKLNSSTYYAYAEALPAYPGLIKTWSGESIFCISEDRFFTQNDQSSCLSNNRLKRSFFKVEVTDKDNGKWRTEFKDKIEYSTETAKIAGVQRLLKALGYNISVDGDFGAQSKRLLYTYKKNNNLTPNDKIDFDVIDDLIDKALKKIYNTGLLICNQTNYKIWFSLMEKSRSGNNTSGWWEFNPNSCDKLINEEIVNKDFYFFAILEKDGKEYYSIPGSEKGCVNPVIFKLEYSPDCQENGYNIQNFRRLNILDSKYTNFNLTMEYFSTTPASN